MLETIDDWGDLFAGGGGTTTGALMLEDVKVKWAINHDPISIDTHKYNHPETEHYEEDITIFNEKKLCKVRGLWASLECQNFSNAKGGGPRDPDSRTLAEHMPRYAVHCDPTYIIIENVREFLKWGPLDKNNKIIKKLEGMSYDAWVKTMCALGYHYDYKIINCADVGCRTIRKRYIGIFAKHGYPIKFPNKTHDKNGEGLPKWLACKDAIDLEKQGKSMFNRKKAYVYKTRRRFAGGILKYSDEVNFLVSYYSNGGKQSSSLKFPAPTITTHDRHALVKFIVDHTWVDYYDMIDRPMRVQTTRQTKQMVHVVPFLSKYFGSKDGKQVHSSSIEDPYPTIMTTRRTAIVTAQHGSNGVPEANNNSINEPLTSISTNRHHQYLTAQYNSGNNPESQVASIDDPLNTITGSNKHSLVTCSLGNDYHFTEERKEFASLIIELYQGEEKAVPIELVYILCSSIEDVLARFLSPKELARITGFPEGYFKLGTGKQIVKMIGNAVPPLLAKVVIGAIKDVHLKAA